MKNEEFLFIRWSMAVKDTSLVYYRSSKKVLRFKINTKSLKQNPTPSFRQLVWEFPASCVPEGRFITCFTIARHWPLSWARLIHYSALLTVPLNTILPSTSSSPEWSLSFMYSHKNIFVWTSQTWHHLAITKICLISGFRRGVNEVLALLGCYLRCVTSQKIEDLNYRDNLFYVLSVTICRDISRDVSTDVIGLAAEQCVIEHVIQSITVTLAVKFR
jgi:hypothetical protein